MAQVSGLRFDAGALEAVARRFRREIWETPPPDAIAECGIAVRSFGPLQATVFVELGDVEEANVILGAAEPGAVGGGHLAAAVEWAQGHEVDYCVAVANGRPGSAEAEGWLSRHRHERSGSWQKFVRDVSPPDLPRMPGIEVLELYEDEGEGMSAIAAGGLGLPEWAGTLFFGLPGRAGWHCFVALLDGSLASCGAMMVGDGIAELGIDATLPEARGRGCQLALLRHRIRVAAELGCQALLIEVGCSRAEQTTVRANLTHAGFGHAYETGIWRLSRSPGPH